MRFQKLLFDRVCVSLNVEKPSKLGLGFSFDNSGVYETTLEFKLFNITLNFTFYSNIMLEKIQIGKELERLHLNKRNAVTEQEADEAEKELRYFMKNTLFDFGPLSLNTPEALRKLTNQVVQELKNEKSNSKRV